MNDVKINSNSIEEMYVKYYSSLKRHCIKLLYAAYGCYLQCEQSIFIPDECVSPCNLKRRIIIDILYIGSEFTCALEWPTGISVDSTGYQIHVLSNRLQPQPIKPLIFSG